MVAGNFVGSLFDGARGSDRFIRWCTTVSVVILAWIAAVLSYKHMYVLVLRYEETSWTAALLPVSVDGMIAASSLTLLADSRAGRRGGLLPWSLLLVGSAASLAANVAVAEPSVIGRLIAAWPSLALIGAYELLMGQIRHAAGRRPDVRRAASLEAQQTLKPGNAASAKSPRVAAAMPAVSHVPHTNATENDVPSERDSYGTFPRAVPDPVLPYASHISGAQEPSSQVDGVSSWDDLRSEGASSRRRRRPASDLQRRAWQWAQANRTPAGDLPSGKEIAQRFGRRERWGRLVKQAGEAGSFDSVVAP